MELKEAVTAFLKARHAVVGGLREVVDRGDLMIFRLTNTDHHIIVKEVLSVVDVQEKTTIATLNTKQNVEYLVAHWDAFLQENLSVLFMNPKTQEQWKVVPLNHEKIAERKNLKQGLMSLFSQITAC